MSDDLESNNEEEMLFDDDMGSDFSDDMDMEFDMFAEEPKPKDRHPVTHSLIKTGRGFREGFTDDKTETAVKAIKASIPSSLSNEASQVNDIVSSVSNVLDETTSEIKAQAKPFVKALDKVIPKGGRTENILKMAKEKFGLESDEPTSEQLAEDAASKAANAVSDILGQQQDRELQSQLLLETVRGRRAKSSIELQAITSTNLEYINKFNLDVVSKYQRKSLELQYRHLYTADEQLSVTKTAFDGFKNQFESIVINSALPDLVKTRNSEFIKQKMFSKMTDGLFNSEGVVKNIKTKFNQEIRGLGSSISGGLSAATDGIEMSTSMSDMEIPGQSKEGMIGGMLADGLINIGGKKFGNILSKTKAGKAGIDFAKEAMLDPSAMAKLRASGMEDGVLKNALNMFSDFTKNSHNEQRFSVDKIDRDGVAMFDGKTQTSITKIIPGLLSKILAQVTTTNTGQPSDELRFDYDTGNFETVSNLRTGISKDFSKNLVDSGVNRTLDSLVQNIAEKTDTDFNAKEMLKFKEGVLSYALTGKETFPGLLKENGFFEMFEGTLSGKVEKAFDKYYTVENGRAQLKHGLDAVVKQAPDPQELMNKYDASGSLDVLKDTGLVKYDDYTKTHKLDNDAYKSALANAIRDAKENDEPEDSSEETMVEKFIREQKEKREQAAKEKAEKKSTEKPKENFFTKTAKRAESSIVSSIDKVTDYGFKGAMDDVKGAYDHTTNKIVDIKRTISGIESINDVKTLIKSTDTAKNAQELHEIIDQVAKKTKDPKAFLDELKQTNEYKNLSKETKDRLDRTISIVKAKSKYAKAKIFKEDDDVDSVMGKLPGFSKGGYTGKGPKDEVAGITHRDEDVVDSGRLDKIANILGMKDLSRDKLVDTLIESTSSIKDSVQSFVSNNDTYKDARSKADEVGNSKLANDIRDRLKTSRKFFGEKIKSTSDSISERLDLDKGISIPEFDKSGIDDVLGSIKEAKDKASANLKVKVFVGGVNKVIGQVEDFIASNPHKSADIQNKLMSLKGKIDSLLSSNMQDNVSVGELIKDISETVSVIVSDMTPNTTILKKKVEDFKEKQVKEGTDEEKFLDILNSEDPVGSMKAKIKQGVKSKIKGFVVGGIKGTFNLGKKLVLSDLERGKKLRGYLKDKFLTPKDGQQHGMLRRGLSGAFSKADSLAGKVGATGKAGISAGAGVIHKDAELGKKLRNQITESVQDAMTKKDKQRDGIAGSNNGKSASTDKDGDGLRDGSWLAKLRKRKADKAKNADEVPKSVFKKVVDKAKSPFGIATVLAGVAMGLRAMGVTMDDISGFAKGAWDTLKGIGSVLGGVWDTVKEVVKTVKSAFGGIKGALSKVPVIGKYFEDDETTNMTPEEIAKQEAEADGKLAGQAAMGLAGLYAGKKAYNIAKPVVNAGVKGAKVVSGVGKKASNSKTAKAFSKATAKKIPGSKIMATLKNFKTQIVKKLGKTASKKILAKLAAKIAARAVPILGVGILVYDAGKIAYDMYSNGTDLKSAISKQILGFDLFGDDVAIDADGKEVKPDEINKKKYDDDDYINSEIEEDEKEWSNLSNSEKMTKRKERKQQNSRRDARKRMMEARRQRALDRINTNNRYSANNTNYGGGGRQYKEISASAGWSKVKGFKGTTIGDVSAHFESGGRGPGTISSGNGDRGGASYGTHQLASKVGTLQKYLAGSKYGVQFSGLRPGSAEFNAKWREIAKKDPEGFKADQEAYIAKTHYQPQVKKLKGAGLDVDKRSNAVKSAVYSAGVQFGPKTSLIKKALAQKGVDPKVGEDKEVITSIYGYKKENNNRLFKSSSANIKKGTLKRAYREEDLVLSLLEKEGGNKPANNIGHKASDGISEKKSLVEELASKTSTDSSSVVTKPAPRKPEVVEDIPTSSMVAGPAMTTTKTTNDNASKPIAQPTKPIMSSVATELKDVKVNKKTEVVKKEVATSGVDAMAGATKGIFKMNKTLEDSLAVQRATLEAVRQLNSTNSKLMDRKLNPDDVREDVKPTNTTNTNKWDTPMERVSTGTVNLKRKKHA